MCNGQVWAMVWWCLSISCSSWGLYGPWISAGIAQWVSSWLNSVGAMTMSSEMWFLVGQLWAEIVWSPGSFLDTREALRMIQGSIFMLPCSCLYRYFFEMCMERNNRKISLVLGWWKLVLLVILLIMVLVRQKLVLLVIHNFLNVGGKCV